MSGEQKSFDTLEGAFEFLDKELEAAVRLLSLYHQHVKELLAQIVEQVAPPKPKRKKKA